MRAELAYCAGLFEGEGTVYLHGGRHHPCPRAQIKMTDREPLEVMLATLGGTITGPYQYRQDRKPAWTWGLHSYGDVLSLYERIGERLSPRRREQFEKVLAAGPGPGKGSHLRSKTHCLRGHAFDTKNTYLYRGERKCRACRRERKRKVA